MKINKITDKALLESVKKQLNEGTGNFYFDNVCLLVTDDDYDAGNYPEFEDRPCSIIDFTFNRLIIALNNFSFIQITPLFL